MKFVGPALVPEPPVRRGSAVGSELEGRSEGCMTFGGINYLAILIAAVVAWLAGAVWYMAFGRAWVAALGISMEELQARRQRPGA